MIPERTSQTVLEEEFLPVRAKILEIAASLDRIQRAEGEGLRNANWLQIQSALETLLEIQEGRAERVQMLFSRPYDEQWRETHKLSTS